MGRTATRTIPQDALDVLARGRCTLTTFFLPPGQLDRRLYQSVNDVLEALGGKWSKKVKGHVFAEDATARIEAAVASGSYDDPKLLAFFATPPSLAAELVERAGVKPGHLCLEPSAGEGAIANALADVVGFGKVACYEIDARRAAVLSEKFVVYGCADFLQAEPMPFDRVVMNPPFSVPGHPRADIEHVEHALGFLRPGGRLVSVMSGGTMFRTDKRTQAFRDRIASLGGTIEDLPEDSFAASGTSVRTCVVEVSL